MGFKRLLEVIEKLKNTDARNRIEARMRDFREIGADSNEAIFKELCFCILTANFNAQRSIKIQNELGEGFLTLSESRLSKRLGGLGHRFPNVRAKYIVEARKHIEKLPEVIGSFDNDNDRREWLAEHVKGIGYKEASHFLRNIGYTNLAIIDFHIIDLLARFELIHKPKCLTKRRYLKIEELLRKIAIETDLNLAELDLYLWYMETGKILK